MILGREDLFENVVYQMKAISHDFDGLRLYTCNNHACSNRLYAIYF